MSSLDYLDLCRLCLVKDRVSVPIFEGEGDVRQIFLKIAACLPVKVAREDKLPKKICDDCVYKVELFYQFWNTTANAEKQLLQWLGEVGLEDKQGYVTNVLNPNVMKQEQSTENRLDGNVMQPVGEHQDNLGMGMMENMGLGIPMIISSQNQQEITSVPMATGGSSVQSVQPVPGPSVQPGHNQIGGQNQTNPSQQEEEEESSEEEENSDEECDGDEGLPVKEEGEEDPGNNRAIEPTTFVNVSLACDEAGPSGLQQQKIADMPDMAIPQPAEGDPKSGEELLGRKIKVRDETGSYRYVILGTRESIERDKALRRQLRKKKGRKPKKRTVKPKEKKESETVKDKEETEKRIDALLSQGHKIEVEVDHVLNEIKNTCPFCGKTFNNAKKVENHVTCVHRKPFRCDKCRRACHTARALEEHKLIHRPDFFFECEICHVKYKSGDGLKRHRIRSHSEYEERYVCEHCGRRYKLKIDLTHHVKRTHSSELQICRYCGKEVKDVRGHEWRHQKRNKDVKYQYTCHLCRKMFHHRSRLDRHLMLHERGFKCEECGKECMGSRELMSHKRFKHGQAKISTCILCQRAFLSVSNFYQHILTHAGIRPYKCDVCEEDFTQRSSLLRHRKHHAGPLPPLMPTHPQIADLARNYLQKLQNDQIDKSYVLNTKS